MATINILVIETECDNCHRLFEQRIQFHFGELWLHVYKNGDNIKWGKSSYDIGSPCLAKVKAYGISENNFCPYCGYENPEECNVIIENDMIKGIDTPVDMDRYTEGKDLDYYYIIDE